MDRLARRSSVIALSVIVCVSAAYSFVRQSRDAKATSASISCRVTLNRKPASNVPVILAHNDLSDDFNPVAGVTTERLLRACPTPTFPDNIRSVPSKLR